MGVGNARWHQAYSCRQMLSLAHKWVNVYVYLPMLNFLNYWWKLFQTHCCVSSHQGTFNWLLNPVKSEEASLTISTRHLFYLSIVIQEKVSGVSADNHNSTSTRASMDLILVNITCEYINETCPTLDVSDLSTPFCSIFVIIFSLVLLFSATYAHDPLTIELLSWMFRRKIYMRTCFLS